MRHPSSRSQARLRSILLGALGLVVLASAAAVAQSRQDYYRRGWSRSSRVPLHEGLPATRDGVVDRNFTFCRLWYRSVRREAGGQGWYTDYPASDHNFMTRFSQLTTVTIARRDHDEPGYAVVSATDDELFGCPFLFASDVGTVGFTELEVLRLREYLLKGGFLWADDFWGERAWRSWVDQIRRILPGAAIVDVEPGHPMLHALYNVREVPQVPSIQFWSGAGRGETSERGAESAVPDLRGIFDEKSGRLLVLMSHDTDIADGWEREGEDEEFFYTFSPGSYALGIDVLIWAMSH